MQLQFTYYKYQAIESSFPCIHLASNHTISKLNFEKAM